MGKEITDHEFDEICFNFGLEAEEDKDCEENIKVETPANRYDILSVEGLA